MSAPRKTASGRARPRRALARGLRRVAAGGLRRLAVAARRARTPLTILAAAAAYGLSAGSVDAWRGALRGIVKFPMLIFLTAALCSLAWWVLARFLTSGLSFRSTVALSLRAFADASVMLAALAPVNLFLGRTIALPTRESLNEYPMFLGLNVAFIAVCGTAAVVRQVCRMRKVYSVPARKALAVAAVWLAVCLLVGGQCAWYLRPFYGNPAVVDLAFILGTRPDSRGARSFYEAVYNLLRPPPLPRDYAECRGSTR